MSRMLIVLCMCIGLISCSKDSDSPEAFPSGDVAIRIRNATAFAFQSVQVKAADGSNQYGTIKAGQSSDYKSFKKAYRYAYVKVIINGQPYELVPIDYVGETPLTPGQYTYALSLVASTYGERIGIQLETP